MTAAEYYASQVERYLEQIASTARSPETEPWGPAVSYRFDPRREPGPNFEILASYVRPEDEVIEVGGGAGRIGLPLARRCRHLTNVEPSAGMRAEFASLARGAGIANVTLVADRWPATAPLSADIGLTVDVTYFVADIVPFLQALTRAARRKVIVSIWEVPPPNWNARLFELAHGVPLAPVPGRSELLAVLAEMEVRPEVIPLPEHFAWPEPTPRTRQDALAFAVSAAQARRNPAAVDRLHADLESLFTFDGERYIPSWRPPSPGLLITWPTA